MGVASKFCACRYQVNLSTPRWSGTFYPSMAKNHTVINDRKQKPCFLAVWVNTTSDYFIPTNVNRKCYKYKYSCYHWLGFARKYEVNNTTTGGASLQKQRRNIWYNTLSKTWKWLFLITTFLLSNAYARCQHHSLWQLQLKGGPLKIGRMYTRNDSCYKSIFCSLSN